MSPPELPPGTATNPAQSICCVYVLAAAILAMVLLGYCCILRRFSGALCGSTRSEDPNAGDPTEEIRYIVEIPDANESAEEIHSVGLEFVILESLRVSEFRKNNEREHSEGSVGCAVCLDEFEEGQLLRHLPNCSHAFHLPCIDTWFESHSNCPVCRSTAYDLTIHGEYSPSAVQGDAIYESSSSESEFDSPSGPAS